MRENAADDWSRRTHFDTAEQLLLALPKMRAELIADTETTLAMPNLQRGHSSRPLAEEDRASVAQELERLVLQAASNDFARDASPIIHYNRTPLVALVARWGRYDVLKQLLSDPDMIEYRHADQVQEALQVALRRVCRDQSFDVAIVTLLLEHGAKISEVSLNELFSTESEFRSRADPYGFFADVTRKRDRLIRKKKRRGGGGAAGAGAGAAQEERTSTFTFIRRRASANEGTASHRNDLDGLRHWDEAQVAVLSQYIEGFQTYASRQRVVRPFDLMIWGICCGAIEFTKVMWERSVSPLRTALIACNMCQRIDANFAENTGSVSSLELQDWLNKQASAVLDQLPDQEQARKLLLTHESDFHDLGTTNIKSNLLEVAVEVRNRTFIAHRYCQGVIDEMWAGRSPMCGRIRLRSTKQSIWRMLCIMMQLIPPFCFLHLPGKTLKTDFNDLCTTASRANDSRALEAPAPAPLPRPMPAPQPPPAPSHRRAQLVHHLARPVGSMSVSDATHNALAHPPHVLPSAHASRADDWPTKVHYDKFGGRKQATVFIQRVEWWRWMHAFWQIPATKRVMSFLFHLLFFANFCYVAFLPLCMPMGRSHFILLLFVCGRLLELLLNLAAELLWHRKPTNRTLDLLWQSTDPFKVCAKPSGGAGQRLCRGAPDGFGRQAGRDGDGSRWTASYNYAYAYTRIRVTTTTTSSRGPRPQLIDFLSVMVLLVFFILSLVARGGRWWEGLPRQAEAEDFIAYLDRDARGAIRSQHLLGHEDDAVLMHPSECGWTRTTELLRTVLAFAAIPIVMGIMEIFSVNEATGVLLFCAWNMVGVTTQVRALCGSLHPQRDPILDRGVLRWPL